MRIRPIPCSPGLSSNSPKTIKNIPNNIAKTFGIQCKILIFILELSIRLYYISKTDFIEEPIFMKNKNSDRKVVVFIYNLLGNRVARSS